MKTKHFFFITCVLAFASCNNVEIPKDGNSIIEINMAMIDKQLVDAEQSLKDQGFDERPSGNENYYREYFRPELLAYLNTESFFTARQNDPYEEVYLGFVDGIVNFAEATQQFVSDKVAFEHFKAWDKYLNNLRTDSAKFYAEIDANEKSFYLDGFFDEERTDYKKELEDMGFSVGSRKDYEDALKKLSLDQSFSVIEKVGFINGQYVHLGYATKDYETSRPGFVIVRRRKVEVTSFSQKYYPQPKSDISISE